MVADEDIPELDMGALPDESMVAEDASVDDAEDASVDDAEEASVDHGEDDEDTVPLDEDTGSIDEGGTFNDVETNTDVEEDTPSADDALERDVDPAPDEVWAAALDEETRTTLCEELDTPPGGNVSSSSEGWPVQAMNRSSVREATPRGQKGIPDPLVEGMVPMPHQAVGINRGQWRTGASCLPGPAGP